MSLDISDLIPSTPLEINNDVDALVEKIGTGTSPVYLKVVPKSMNVFHLSNGKY